MTERLLTPREVGEFVGLSTETVLHAGEPVRFRGFAWLPTCSVSIRLRLKRGLNRVVAFLRSGPKRILQSSVIEPRMNVPTPLRELSRPGGRRLNRRTPGLWAERGSDAR